MADKGDNTADLVDVQLLLKDARAALFPFLTLLKGWSQVLRWCREYACETACD